MAPVWLLALWVEGGKAQGSESGRSWDPSLSSVPSKYVWLGDALLSQPQSSYLLDGNDDNSVGLCGRRQDGVISCVCGFFLSQFSRDKAAFWCRIKAQGMGVPFLILPVTHGPGRACPPEIRRSGLGYPCPGWVPRHWPESHHSPPWELLLHSSPDDKSLFEWGWAPASMFSSR